ncbi:hypothetical protein AVE30378_06194 [Achromobacter veterisilvae]|uniref:Uncharacterized protein n=1 Tax=Achromobacter veterisilvae TaxID=2069367 RepID=A0A446D1B4_9BURK|nr:hypothetical protein AVE30378_06194 [Achromobacter veterisilvae]
MSGRIVLFGAGDDLVVFPGRVHGGRAGQRAGATARGRRGGRHMVEETVVLIEHQQQHRLAPDLRIGGQRIQYPRRVVRALRRAGRAGVFGAGLGGADPGHLRQLAVQHVLAQRIQAARGQGLVLQRGQRARRPMVGVAVGLEARRGVERIVVRHVLVDAPTDAGRLQPLGVGRPGVPARRVAARQLVVEVAQRRAVPAAQAVVGAGPQEQPVGVGAAGERTVIGVAHGEGARHGVLEGHVAFREVGHGMVLLGRGPLAHAAAVPGRLRIRPGMRRAGDAHVLRHLARVRVKGQDGARPFAGLVVVLRPDRAMRAFGAVGHGDREPVAEAAHARQPAEIMVERAVLLHEDHDVLHIADRARAAGGGNREGAAQRRRQQGQGAARGGERGAVAEEVAACVHGVPAHGFGGCSACGVICPMASVRPAPASRTPRPPGPAWPFS